MGLHYSNEKKYGEAFLILRAVSGAVEESVEFAQKNGLMQSAKVKKLLKESEEEGGMLKTLGFLICKCHSKLVMQQYEEFSQLNQEEEVKTGESKDKMTQVKFDNLYDILFDADG